MNRTTPRPTQEQTRRLPRLTVRIAWLALALAAAGLIAATALAAVVLAAPVVLSTTSPGQVSFAPSLSVSSSGPQLSVQAEPYDVTVTIDDLAPNPVMAGQPVTITASVTSTLPFVGVPGGKLVIEAGQNLECQITLDASGAGLCSLVFPLSGLTPLKAVYPGQSPFLPGISDVTYLTVDSQGSSEIVYQHDFETPVGTEWCLPRQDITPSGRGFLGQFASETACLQLTSLPLHQQVSVSFDLYIIRSWNGNQVSAGSAPSVTPSEPDIIVGPDLWKIEADGQLLMLTSFSNWFGHLQAYPGSYPGSDYPRFTGALEAFTLGYQSTGGIMDSVYRLTYTFNHTQSAVNLDFTAVGLQSVNNESWGLDNITVRCLIPATLSSGKASQLMSPAGAR